MQPARSAGKTSPGQANTGYISLCLWVETWREICNPPMTPDHQPHTKSTPLVAFLVEGESEFVFTKFTYFYLSGRLDTLCHVRQSEDCSQQKIFHLKRTRKKGPRMVCLKTLTFVGHRWRFNFFFRFGTIFLINSTTHVRFVYRRARLP